MVFEEKQSGGGSSKTMSSEMDEMYEIGRKAWKSASRAAKHMSKHSRIVNPRLEKQIPRFEEHEVVVGKLLGSGGFNNVYELQGIKLVKDPLTSEHARKISSDLQTERRRNVANHCYREASESSRFAIKFLSKESLQDPDRFCTGAADLVVEAKFLASLEHPNIVKLRGMAAAGTSGFATCRQQGYFLILDRLQCTLDDKLEEWMEIEKRAAGSLQRKLLDRSGKKHQQFLADRLKVALDVASALTYLHSNNIIFRDLKPDNIGFDVRGDVKLFDFGLAKELDDSMKSGYCSEFYELSGNTGSLRYMAPEVALSECYNLSADVYSFGLLLWQICSLDLPYDGMSRTDHSVYVVKGNERPVLDPSWSTPLRILMKRAWEPNPSVRPSMDSTHKILKREIISLRDGDDSGLEFSRRSSSCVLNDESTATNRGRPSLAADNRGSLRNMLKQVSVRGMTNHRSLRRFSAQEGQQGKMPAKSNSSRALVGHLVQRTPSKGAVAA
ncbi:protein kinase [Fragilaria crotonensis]|nr:protein kinase [Fragilaria crotonensis]